jgi:hypothetical protein
VRRERLRGDTPPPQAPQGSLPPTPSQRNLLAMLRGGDFRAAYELNFGGDGVRVGRDPIEPESPRRAAIRGQIAWRALKSVGRKSPIKTQKVAPKLLTNKQLVV